MPTTPARLLDNLVNVASELDQEFEARLVESSTLAYRVAFGVLRQREDAEDVAQEALPRRTGTFVNCGTLVAFERGLFG